MSRSHVVDFDALTTALTEARFRAAIDVFPQEPMPSDHPIRRAPNVVLSAHRAGSIVGDSNLIGRNRTTTNTPTSLRLSASGAVRSCGSSQQVAGVWSRAPQYEGATVRRRIEEDAAGRWER